jgi:hypothetical protein
MIFSGSNIPEPNSSRKDLKLWLPPEKFPHIKISSLLLRFRRFLGTKILPYLYPLIRPPSRQLVLGRVRILILGIHSFPSYVSRL